MQTTTQIATHFRQLYFGGNWTYANMKDTLTGVDWQMATSSISSFNTIATLVFHVGYYITVESKVLKGGPLEGSDKLSFEHPPVTSAEAWQALLDKTFAEASLFADAIEQLPDTILFEDFGNGKYGNYYRNLHGIIEHTHYHLGQITLLKKLLSEKGHNATVS
jgi:uncharacterized damage-inducible protein DinB